MEHSFYSMALNFFIYAILGWGVEVVYATVNSGKFVNRGFLNGPYCPIYGFGVLIVALCLMPLQKNLAALFFGSVLLTTLLELVTGFLLERIFNEKWWDYTDEHFNFRGYICVKFSILWGMACVMVIRVIHPMVLRFVHWLPHTAGVIVLAVLLTGFACDAGVTVLAILKIKKKIRLLDTIAKEMRSVSDQLGENLSEGVLGAMERNRKSKQEFALRRELTMVELDDLRAKAEALAARYKVVQAQRPRFTSRFRSAYPRLFTKLTKRIEHKEWNLPWKHKA